MRIGLTGLRWLAALWIGMIVVLSLSPLEVKVAAGTETVSPQPASQHAAFVRHSILHVFAFLVGAKLLTASAGGKRGQVIGCVCLAILGCALEWVQFRYFGATVLETWDMAYDAVGVACGFAMATTLRLGERVRAAPTTKVG